MNASRLMAFLFFGYTVGSIFANFIPLYFKEIGLSGQEIGWLLAIGPIAGIISQPIWGFFSDKFKSIKITLIICISGAFFISLALLKVSNFPALMIFLFLFFFFYSAITPLGDSLANQTSKIEKIPFGKIRMWGSLGFGLSAMIIGYILTITGIDKVLIPLLVALFITFAISFFLKDVNTSNRPVSAVDAVKIGVNPQFMTFVILIMLISITHRTNDFFLGFYLKELGGSETTVGISMFIGVSTEVAIMATAFYWFRKYHETIFIIIAGIIYTVRWILMSLASTPMEVLILQPLHGISFGILYISAFQYVSKLLPKHLQATGHGVFITFLFGISGIIGSLIGGSLLDATGLSRLYHFMAASSAAGVLSFIGYRYKFVKQEIAKGEELTRSI
jgi:oligosaccharide:H+ symporter